MMRKLTLLTFGREVRMGSRIVVICLIALMVFGCAPVPAEKASPKQPDRTPSAEIPEATKQRIGAAYGQLPLSFEANQGQTDDQVQFLARGSGYTLFLTPTEAIFALQQVVAETEVTPSSLVQSIQTNLTERAKPTLMRMQLVGANPAPQMGGLEKLPGRSHYYIGNDPQKWHTDVPHFARVEYQDVYPGVDLVYHGDQRQLEYDFVVAPGTDPGGITLAFQGVDQLEIDDQGNLVLQAAGGEVVQHAPVVYQEIDGIRQAVAGDYVLKGEHQVGFQLGAYDASQSLVIDPVLIYSTYYGGSTEEIGYGIAVDAAGNAYVARTVGSFVAGEWEGDVYVAKLDPTGSTLIYSTHFGGDLEDFPTDIAVDSDGQAYVTGWTWSANFPTTPNALQPAHGDPCGDYLCSDAFMAQLDADGHRIYSTYLGGTEGDSSHGIDVDVAGKAYVTGWTQSPNFPITENAFQSTRPTGWGRPPDLPVDGFVAKIDPSQSPENQLVYSTCLGGLGRDAGASGLCFALDPVGLVHCASTKCCITRR